MKFDPNPRNNACMWHLAVPGIKYGEITQQYRNHKKLPSNKDIH